MKYASVGSISHGTARLEDLLPTFADELEQHVENNKDEWQPGENNHGPAMRDVFVKTVADARAVTDYETDESCEVLNDLGDALEFFAPPYCYFGLHEGDGSDYGFWPQADAIEELPKIKDNSLEAIREAAGIDKEDVAYVNDHGNVTVYSHDGKVLLELV